MPIAEMTFIVCPVKAMARTEPQRPMGIVRRMRRGCTRDSNWAAMIM